MTNPQVALAIVTLVFYVLASPLAVYNTVRHGFTRSGPWYFMLLLCLVRLIGEPMLIASNGTLSGDNGVSIAGFILSGIGLSPLLLMTGAMIQQINNTLSEPAIRPTIVRFLGLVPIAALIVGAIGNSNQFSSDPDTQNTAMSERVAGTALYLVYFGLVLLAALSLYRVKHVLVTKLATVFFAAAVISLPFLLVRLIDQCLTTFGTVQDQTANTSNIYIRALMGSLMEFVVVIVYLVAGFVTADAGAEARAHKKAMEAARKQEDGMAQGDGQWEEMQSQRR